MQLSVISRENSEASSGGTAFALEPERCHTAYSKPNTLLRLRTACHFAYGQSGHKTRMYMRSVLDTVSGRNKLPEGSDEEVSENLQ